MWIKRLAIAAVLLLALGGAAAAQYTPIPNYGANCSVLPDQPGSSGYCFRNDVNGNGSGARQTSPQLVHIPFASLPAEKDGQMFYVTNGTPGTPCTGGGAGAVAIGIQGVWYCALPSTTSNNFAVPFNFVGTPQPSQISAVTLGFTIKVPANYLGPDSACSCGTNPTGTDVYTVKCNGTAQGNFSLSSACALTLPSNAGFTCSAKQRIEMDAVGAPTGKDVACSIGYTR